MGGEPGIAQPNPTAAIPKHAGTNPRQIPSPEDGKWEMRGAQEG